MVDEADVPDSETVPLSLRGECSPILRVAKYLHRTNPRIAYLCVHGAVEESKMIDPLLLGRGVSQFSYILNCWIEKNDETSRQGQFHSKIDVLHLQSFCLDYYEKNIISVIKFIGNQCMKANIDSSVSATVLEAASPPNDNQAPTRVNVKAVSDHLIHACEIASVLFKVLELLSKDVQVSSEILEAHTDVKQLAKIFRPYNLIPHFDYHPIKKLPELEAAICALTYRPWSAATHKKKRDEDIDDLGMLNRVNNPSHARAQERLACRELKPAVVEIKTVVKPHGLQVSLPEVLIFLVSVHFLLFFSIFCSVCYKVICLM